MSERSVNVVLRGLTPLLMHAYPMIPIEAIEKKSIEEQAEYAAYRDPDTKVLYVPGYAVQRALVGAATFSKGKSRSSLQKAVAACVMVSPERISVGTKTFEIDSRPVVIKATGGRIVRYRPRLNKWEIAFDISWDDTLLTEAQLRRVVDDMGSRVGLLDFRPERKGPFGRSMVVQWKNRDGTE